MNLRNTRAFTLIELIVVIVIIGILAAIAAVSYNAFIAGSNESATESSAVQVGKILAGESAFEQEGLTTYDWDQLPADVQADINQIESGNSKHVIITKGDSDQVLLLNGTGNTKTFDDDTLTVCNEDYSYCVSSNLPVLPGGGFNFAGESGDSINASGPLTAASAVADVLNDNAGNLTNPAVQDGLEDIAQDNGVVIISNPSTVTGPSDQTTRNPDGSTTTGSTGNDAQDGTVEVCDASITTCVSGNLPETTGDTTTITGSSNITDGNTGGNSANVAAVLNGDNTITVTWTAAAGVSYELGAGKDGATPAGYIPGVTSPYVLSASLPAGEWTFDVREAGGSSVGTATVTKGTVANNFGNLQALQPTGQHVDGTAIPASSSPILQWEGDTLNDGGSYTYCINGVCEPVVANQFNSFGSSNFVDTQVGPGSYTFSVIDNNTNDVLSTSLTVAALDTTPRIAPGSIGGFDASFVWFGGNVRDFRWTQGANTTGWVTTTGGNGINVSTLQYGSGLLAGQTLTLEVRDLNNNIVSESYTEPGGSGGGGSTANVSAACLAYETPQTFLGVNEHSILNVGGNDAEVWTYEWSNPNVFQTTPGYAERLAPTFLLANYETSDVFQNGGFTFTQEVFSGTSEIITFVGADDEGGDPYADRDQSETADVTVSCSAL